MTGRKNGKRGELVAPLTARETACTPNCPAFDVAAAAEAAGEIRAAAALRAAQQYQQSLYYERMMIAFENIREGMVMYDESECLVMMNRRYAEMYMIPDHMQQPGTSFSDLVAYWGKIKLMNVEENLKRRQEILSRGGASSVRLHLGDGRVYELNEQPLPGGGWVATHEDITARYRAEERILYLAQHDFLTGLGNRKAFHDSIATRLQHSKIGGARSDFVLLVLDLDRFKAVNDLHGHEAGDQVLLAVARRVRGILGKEAPFARLGGDEFAVILDCADMETACRTAMSIVEAIRLPIPFNHQTIEIGASVGLAAYPAHGRDPSTLLKCADRALYVVKHSGGEPVREYHAELDAEEMARIELIRRLPMALANGEIELHYQPIVEAKSGECRTAEALLRWNHPERGWIPPDKIIALAEESRQIGRLGDWILRKALAAVRTWPEHVSISVNVSASQFKSAGFCASVKAALAAVGIEPERLELELTETVLCDDDAAGVIEELRDHGIRFSLDDFGTGYASLSYLLRFPFDRVKIDRAFVTALDKLHDRRIIVEAVASLATRLGLEVVAEGVETEAERDALVACGCGFLQGYMFGRPVNGKAFLAKLWGKWAV